MITLYLGNVNYILLKALTIVYLHLILVEDSKRILNEGFILLEGL